MPILRSLAVVVVAASGLCAQQTFIVQGGGSAYAQALTAANHGDTLIVRAGRYDSAFARVGVTVLCDPGVEFLGGLPMGAYGLPAGTNFVLRGGRLVFQMHFFDVQVSDCAGNVVFEDFADDASLGMIISNSGSVAFHRCRFGKANVTDSTLALAECAVRGSLGVPSFEVTRSEIAVAGGSLRGSDSALGGFFPP